MATYTYTGSLTDVKGASLGDLTPRLTVRPECEAMGPDGVVSDHRVEVAVSGTSFSMKLIPSSQLQAMKGGGAGVKYILELSMFALTQTGERWEVWSAEWRFTAFVGGGSIADMGDVPPLGLYFGPPWPSSPRPGLYIDRLGDYGTYRMGDN